jgi:TatD DNase family protein
MPGHHDAVIEWFDSHCHLQEEFTEGAPGAHASGLAGALARAAEAGVTRMVCIGTGAATSQAAMDLVQSQRHPDSPATAEGVELWATIGLHPHDAKDGVDSILPLFEGLRGPADGGVGDGEGGVGGDAVGGGGRVVVAVGECGLDYHYDHSPRSVQRDTFARQIELATRQGLTLIVHTREAWDDTIGILSEAGPPARTVIHCFTGGPKEARRCLDLGASLSFSGVVTFKNAAEVRDAAELCPLDRLLVETDAPFLSPVPHRGSPNEPSRVALVGATVAEVKGLTAMEVAARTTANALAAFAL